MSNFRKELMEEARQEELEFIILSSCSGVERRSAILEYLTNYDRIAINSNIYSFNLSYKDSDVKKLAKLNKIKFVRPNNVTRKTTFIEKINA